MSESTTKKSVPETTNNENENKKGNDTMENTAAQNPVTQEPQKENFLKKTGRKIKEFGKDTAAYAKAHPIQFGFQLLGLGFAAYQGYKYLIEPTVCELRKNNIQSAQQPALPENLGDAAMPQMGSVNMPPAPPMDPVNVTGTIE